jgi:integrase
VPAAITGAGDHAVRRFLEFFAATIRNRNTREAYYRAAGSFFAWLDQHDIGELDDIESMHVSLYREALQATAAKPTVKQHLAAIRMLFDWLVVGQVLATNLAHSVRGPKHVVRRGKTPVPTREEARQLLDSIDTTTLIGRRDRALIAVMTFAFARIGAVVAMRTTTPTVRGPRHVVTSGQAPVLDPAEARTARQHRCLDGRRSARWRPDRADGLFVRPDRCRARHGGRGCLNAKPPPLGAAARERRQAARDAVPPQP